MSEPNDHTTKFFAENLLAIKMKKTEILMNKPAHLGLYVKPKYDEKDILCYIDADGSTVYIKTDNIFEDFAEDVEIRFYT